jgi:mRNA-degrading endonuclease toxin of MazEF toxin-antitoxin module
MAGNYKTGDVVDVNLGSPPDQVKGHEQGNIRPCLVAKSFERLGLLIVLPITGTEQKYSLYTIVEMQAGTGGLTKTSYVLCHQIRTISLTRINKKRGSVTSRDLSKVISVLRDTLEL